MEVTFGQDWKGRWGGLHPLACESWSVLKGHQCSERGGQGWGENVTWHGVWGNWNKERMELDKEPRTLALLLIRFTVRNFSWCQTGLYKKKKKISLEQGFSKLWGISICVPWCLLLVRTDLYQPECWEKLIYPKWSRFPLDRISQNLYYANYFVNLPLLDSLF